MKNVVFLHQGKKADYREADVLHVEESESRPTGVILATDLYDATPCAFLDLDQVEELHRRLGEHLKEHGRTPKPEPVKKWRDG